MHNQDTVNIIKGLIMDATRKANSGHPGGAMSSADFGYVLFKEFLNFDPDNPDWFDRDRFVLSAGHESMLLYSLLTLAGFLNMDDLKEFRQWGSRTPGHPEHDMTPGVEATTGPLGQGVAMACGMATAEAHLRGKLGSDICSHFTYALASDGDMQEPVAYGSAALAGQWGLGRLIVFFDSNKIQLAGPTDRSDCTDYPQLYRSLCWQVIEIDGHDHGQIREAIKKAKKEENKPTLIIGHTTMASGSATLEGSEATHGSPFSPEEIKASKEKIGLPADEEFFLPSEAITDFQSRFPELRERASAWKDRFKKTMDNSPELLKYWEKIHAAPEDRQISWPDFDPEKPLATRKAFGACLNHILDQVPNLMGGSADLDPSNQTVHFRNECGIFNGDNPCGRYLPFGVREFPMGGILNGLALHGGIVPLGATFLVFSDYERNAIRMSALQKLPVLHVFTHDSFYVGEDGPTHQPVEHANALRTIPNLNVFRPADANETKKCMHIALTQRETPSALLFTRQGLPVLTRENYPRLEEGVDRGAYILREADGPVELILLASGSEVHLALKAAEILDKKVRVISVPCMEIFDAQPEDYRRELLPEDVSARFAVEAGDDTAWYKYVGTSGKVFGLNHFGASAPAGVLAEKYGFTAEKLARFIKDNLK
jgi:transketolase